MAEFALELYVSRSDDAAVRRSAARAREAAEDLSRKGAKVRYLRSIFMPEDETCFLFFEASSAVGVGEVADRAALPAGRIVEASAAW